MKDPRKVRQPIQAIIAIAVAVIPWLIPALDAYPRLKGVSSALGVLLALLTNPRLVAVLDAAMPAAGSSAVLPTENAQPKGPTK